MKNHWLDKKTNKEIETLPGAQDLSVNSDFKDTDIIDLSAVMNKGCYKEYERLLLKEEFIEKVVPKCEKIEFDFFVGDPEGERNFVKQILLKYVNEPRWIDEILNDIGYFAPPADIGFDIPLCISTSTILGDITLDTSNLDTNFTITLGDGFPQDNANTINDVCCGFPQDDEYSKQAGCCGDFVCNCSANLDIFYPDRFIQNETLQVISDRIEGRDITQYQTMYTPVLPGTMTGTVYPNPESDCWGFVFTVSADGKFDFKPFVKEDDGTFKFPEEPDSTLNQEESDRLSLEKLANGEFDETFFGWYDEVYAWETSLNCATGVLELHYHMGRCPKVVVSYEYNKEI